MISLEVILVCEHGFWGVLARNAKDILDDDDNGVQDYDSPRTTRTDMLSMPTRGTFNCCCIVEYLKNDQNLDVVLGEAVAVDGASVHSSDVVYAAFELRLRSLVVVSYPHCLFHHF
ncbi:hypothetical protein EV1_001625 [Malus domestica]